MTEDTRGADHRLSLVISNLVGRSCLLLREVSETSAKLALLDNVTAHDAEVTAEQLKSVGRDADWDEVRSAIGAACIDLRHEVRYAENAHDHMKGLLRGELKHKYEELLARGARAAKHRLEQMEQFSRDYKPPVTAFAIRQLALSALVEHCLEVGQQARSLRLDERTRGVSADFKDELRSSESELFELKGILGKLRDNPSQKMETPLADCIRRADATRQRLSAVMASAKTRSGRHF